MKHVARLAWIGVATQVAAATAAMPAEPVTPASPAAPSLRLLQPGEPCPPGYRERMTRAWGRVAVRETATPAQTARLARPHETTARSREVTVLPPPAPVRAERPIELPPEWFTETGPIVLRAPGAVPGTGGVYGR